MADTFKVLGQVRAVALVGTPEDEDGQEVYTVPDGAQTTVSSIVACHAGTGSNTYYIAIRPSAAPKELKHYIAYAKAIQTAGNAIVMAGITLNDGDVIEVQSDSNDVVFSVFGVETV